MLGLNSSQQVAVLRPSQTGTEEGGEDGFLRCFGDGINELCEQVNVRGEEEGKLKRTPAPKMMMTLTEIENTAKGIHHLCLQQDNIVRERGCGGGWQICC